MKILHQWLISKGLAKKAIKKFKEDLMSYWFSTYPRLMVSKVEDSSGFENVFLGEIYESRMQVKSFYNWFFAYRLQHKNIFEIIKLIDFCPNDVVTFGFKWLFEAHNICDDRCKNPSRDGSVHIVAGKNCEVELEGNKHNIKSYTKRNDVTHNAVASS